MNPEDLPEHVTNSGELFRLAKAPKAKKDKCPECGGTVEIVSRSTPQVRVCGKGHGWFWWRGKRVKTKPTIRVEASSPNEKES